MFHSKNNRSFLARLLALALLTIFLAKGGLAIAETSPPAPRPLAVEMLTAERTPGKKTFAFTGEIVARSVLDVSFPTSGRILTISVSEGDKVARGTELARMESVQQEQALQAAQAALQAAEADYKQRKEEFERQNALLARGATTRIRRDEAERSFRIAEANLERTRAELERARKALEDTILLAPEDATVTARLADPGQVVGAASPVISLALGDGYDAVFHAPETLPAKAPDDIVVNLSLIENPTIAFKGKIRKLSPLVDPKTGTVKVTVGIIDPPPQIGYGDAVRGTVERKLPPHFNLPYTALTATRLGTAVWIVDPANFTVFLRQVTVSQFEDGIVTIESGLSDGEMVVGRGSHLLYPGREVRPAERIK